MPLCRKKITIRQSKWPALYGARTEIWYRQRHLVTSPTGFGRVKVVSTLGTGRPKRHFFTTQGPESRSMVVSSQKLILSEPTTYFKFRVVANLFDASASERPRLAGRRRTILADARRALFHGRAECLGGGRLFYVYDI